MTEQKQGKECPECNGKKIIPGVCECDSEWRGTQNEEDWIDCQCTPDISCPVCQGKGYIES